MDRNRLLINNELLTVLHAALSLNANHQDILLEDKEPSHGRSAIVNIN